MNVTIGVYMDMNELTRKEKRKLRRKNRGKKMNLLKMILESIRNGSLGKAGAKALAIIGLKKLFAWYQNYVENNEDHLDIIIEIEGKEPVQLVVSTARIDLLTNKLNIPYLPKKGETITLNDIDKVVISRVDLL